MMDIDEVKVGRLTERARQRGYKLSPPDSPAEYGWWLAWLNQAQWVSDMDAVERFIATPAAERVQAQLDMRAPWLAQRKAVGQ